MGFLILVIVVAVFFILDHHWIRFSGRASFEKIQEERRRQAEIDRAYESKNKAYLQSYGTTAYRKGKDGKEFEVIYSNEKHAFLQRVLRVAIMGGEIINIQYWGGTKPGSNREILPISLNGNLLRARCLSSNKIKNFRLERIDLDEEMDSAA